MADRRRTSIALLALVLIGAAAAFFVGRATAPDEATSKPDSDREASTNDPGPTDELNGVPIGYARSEAGAIEAATNFARVMGTTDGDFDAYFSAMETIAAAEWRNDAEELAQNGIDFVMDRYGEGGTLTFVPVRYRVEQFSDSDATVAVWGVTLSSGPKVQGLDQTWVTGTIHLGWVTDDWRVVGGESTPGPSPRMLNDSNTTPGDLDGFLEYERAPRP